MLATCDHLRKFLKNLKVAEQKDENMIREIILPYLDRQIAAAGKKSGQNSVNISNRLGPSSILDGITKATDNMGHHAAKTSFIGMN